MPPIDDLEKRIDTNKRNGMEIHEITKFAENEANVQELGKRLEQTFNFNSLNSQDNRKFLEAVRNATLNNQEFQQKIKNKIRGNVGGLTDSDVFLLYLQCLTENPIGGIRTPFNTPQITNSKDIYTKYGGQVLLNYIRTKYNNPRYEFSAMNAIRSTSTINRRNTTTRNTNNQGFTFERQQRKEVPLPEGINCYRFGNNREKTHMPSEFYRLDERAKENYGTEYDKERTASRKRNGEKGDKINDYVKYDLYIFAIKKYQQLIEEKYKQIITGSYGNEQNFNNQQNLAKKYFEDIEKINKEYPDIQEIVKKMADYDNKLEKIQNKYLKNVRGENMQKKEEYAQERYKTYIAEVEKKGEELGIKEIENSIPNSINSSEDLVKFFENINKFSQFQTEQNNIKNKYGNIIDNYENYIGAKGKLIKSYGKNNLQQWIEKYKEYGEKIKECKNKYSGFNFEKYKKCMNDLSDLRIPQRSADIKAFSECLNIKNKYFPIRGIKEDYETQQREQAETDRKWANLKEKSRILYQVCNIGARGVNALVSSTRGAGAKLGAMVCSLWHDDDEMVALWERAGNGFWNPHFNMSTRQLQSAYENGKINFNWDNGPGIIAEGVVNMLTLIGGGGAIKTGILKGSTKLGIGVGSKGINIAGKVGLFSSGFIQQAGASYEEGFKAGMTGNQILIYTVLSAGIQGGLELVSPNEVILGSGSNLAKSYIKEILKTESTRSLKAIGKLFLKNVGSEIIEENLQEALQLAAGNLINMRANNQFDLGKISGTEKLEADRNPKNFAATALVTTLTTGVVTGGSFAMQTPGIGNTQDREKLISYIQLNPELRGDVMNILDKAIAGNIKIPNVNIQEIENLKLELNGKIIKNTKENQQNYTGKIQNMKEGDIKELLDKKGEIKLEELSANDLRLLMFKACNMGLDFQTIEKLGVAIEHSIIDNPKISPDTKTELKNYVNKLCYMTEIKNVNINEDTSRIEKALDEIEQHIENVFKNDSITAKELSIEINKKKFELYYKKIGDIEKANSEINKIKTKNNELLSNDTNNFRYRRGILETNLLEIQLGGEGGKKALDGLTTNAQEVREKTETIGGRTDTETLISKIEAGIILGKSEGELQPYLDFLALTEHGAGINILGTVIQTINTTFDSDGAKGALEKYSDDVTNAGEKSKDSHLMEAGEKAKTISEKYNQMKNSLETDHNDETYTEIQSRLEKFVKGRNVSSISDVGNNFSHFTVLLNPQATKNSPVMSIEIGKVDYETAYNTLKTEFQNEGIDLEGNIGDYNTFIGKFNKVVDNRIRTTFGTKNLQELNSSEHRALFDYIAAKYMEGRRGDQNASLTNLSQLFSVKGLQDCRLHAFTKQLFFDSWKTNKLNSLEKSKTGKTEAEITKINEQIKIIENTKMVFMDAQFSGNVDMNTIYVARTEDGHMVKGSQNNVIEEHTFNLIEIPILNAEGNIQYNKDGSIIKKVCYADSFYHGNDGKVYDLSYTGEDISNTIYGKKGEDVYMTTTVTGADGKPIHINVKPLGWSIKGRGDNITGSSIEVRGPNTEEVTDLNNQYNEGLKKVETLSKNREEIQRDLNSKLELLKSGQKVQPVDIEKTLTSTDGHKVAERQANQIKRAFELIEKIPIEEKGKALLALQTMIGNIVTQNDIDFASGKNIGIDEHGNKISIQLDKKHRNATRFLESEGVFFNSMQIFNDVYRAKIEEATKQLDPNDPESVKKLQDAIKEYQEIYDTDMKDFFERSQQTMLDDGKRGEEYHRNNFKHIAERFKSDSDTYTHALKKYEELGIHKQAFTLRQQIKTQYNKLLSNSQELLGHFINSDKIKSELKGPLGREIYAKLISIQKRIDNGKNVDFNEEFGKDSDKIKNLLGIESWSKDTIEASIKKMQESGLADYYTMISLVHNSQIEQILTEDAVYGSKEKGYYHTQEKGYVSESHESYEDRMTKNKVFEEGLMKGEKKLGDIGQHLRGLIETNEVIDNTSKIQINNLISNMISEFGNMFSSNLEAYKFFKATTEVLILQTMESDTRSMGDHGINHISGNIAKLSNYLKSEGSLKGDLKKWQFMGYITHIFHDKGYAALIAQGANHRKGTDLHPFTSKMYFNDIIKPLLNNTGINTDLISQAIESHDGINLDFSSNENIFLSRVNISDNMALGIDKVPILWRHKKILSKITLLYEWSKSGMDLKEGINTIKENIDKDGKLSINEKEALKSAIGELNRRSFENIDFLSIHPTGNSEVLENGVRRINMYKATSFEIAAEICGINSDELNALIIEAKKTGDTSKLIELIKNDKFGNQIVKPLKDYQDKYILTNKDGKEYPKKKNKKGKYEYDRDIVAADLLIGKPVQIQNGVKAEANEDFVQSNGETIAEYLFKENEEIPDNLKDKNYENIENQTVEYIDGIIEAENRSQIESIGNIVKSMDGLINAVQKKKSDISSEISDFRRSIGEIQTGGSLNTEYLNAIANIQDKLKEFDKNHLIDHGGDGQEAYSYETIENELGTIKKDIEKLITYLV